MNLSEIVDRVEREHERIVLTRNGRPAAVIMSPEDLESLEDTLDLLSDPAAMRDIDIAREDLREGRVLAADQTASQVPPDVSEPGYRLVVAASAERSLARLPEAVAAAVVEFMVGPLVANPHRVGHPCNVS